MTFNHAERGSNIGRGMLMRLAGRGGTRRQKGLADPFGQSAPPSNDKVLRLTKMKYRPAQRLTSQVFATRALDDRSPESESPASPARTPRNQFAPQRQRSAWGCFPRRGIADAERGKRAKHRGRDDRHGNRRADRQTSLQHQVKHGAPGAPLLLPTAADASTF